MSRPQRTHNKKRNVGLIYELLLREVSARLLEGVQDPEAVPVAVVRRHFREGTEILREFRLFKALVGTRASSPAVAATVLSEARAVARSIDPVKLDREKSALIADVNRRFDRGNFYGRRVPDYRMLATVQTLFNDWRSGDADSVTRIAEFEEKVREHLTSPGLVDLPLVEHVTPDADALVLRIMGEKVDSRFGSQLTPTQRSILREYVLSDGEDRPALREMLAQVKVETLTALDRFLLSERNEVLDCKAEQVRRDVTSLPETCVTDEDLTRYLTVCHLRDAVLSEGS